MNQTDNITYDKMVECSGVSRPAITNNIKTIRMMLEYKRLEKWLEENG